MSELIAGTIGRIQGRKTYRILADHLREQILSGHIPEGSPLPNERDLCDTAGLSRGSVREALRMLEVEGLLSIKSGRNGGSTIRLPGSDLISRSVGAYVRGQRLAFDAVLEVREALEPSLASLAALHRTEEDMRAIANAAAATEAAGEDNAAFIAANDRWHWAVAQSSHNPLLIAMVEAIGDLLHRSNVVGFVSAPVREAVIRAHARIEDAIRAGDPEAAARRMARHVRSYRQQVAAVAPESLDMP